MLPSILKRRRRAIVRTGVAVLMTACIVPAAADAVGSTKDENGNTTSTTVPPPIDEDEIPEYDHTTTTPVPVITTDAGTTIDNGSSCLWTVKGRLVVRNPTVDGLVDNDPLKDVEVKVSGRGEFGVTYSSWGTTRTDENGDFSVNEIECSSRRVKVEAHFESDDLRTTSSQSTNWYELHNTGGQVNPATIDLRREPFGGEPGDQGTNQARTDAQTWAFFQRAIEYADDIGHEFDHKVVVHNPATLTSGVSATDPILQDIHIDPSDTASLDVWEHELGHAWPYPYVSGEGCLTWDAVRSGTTHDQFEEPCIAWAEGFAEAFANKLEPELENAGLLTDVSESSSSLTPNNRAKLADLGLDTINELEQSEFGWEQVFYTLTSSDITRHLYGEADDSVGSGLVGSYTAGVCHGPSNVDDLADLLQAVGDDDDRLDINDVSGDDQLSVENFVQRYADRVSGFVDSDVFHYVSSIDPESWSEPHYGYGC